MIGVIAGRAGAGGAFFACVLACTPLGWFSAQPEARPRTTGGAVAAASGSTPVEVAAFEPEEPRSLVEEPPSEPLFTDSVALEPAAVVAEAAFSAASAPDDPPATGELRIERGEGLLPLAIPRGEQLEFDVEVDLGALGDPRVGHVKLSSGVEPYIEGLPSRGASAKKRGKEVGWMKSAASGSHLGYTLDHRLEARHLPQVMPRILFNDVQKGSENRLRRLKLGESEGKQVAVYENDGHCKEKGCARVEHFVESKWIWGKPFHCEKCKLGEHRVLRPARTRDAPKGALDMLSAVYLARTMVMDGLAETEIAVVDKQKLWNVKISRGKKKTIEVPAGRFECTLVQLVTRVPEGEPDDGEGFEGLFGIQGTIAIWFESKSGVPVLISGTLPVPVIGELDVRVELVKFKGTPATFAPVK